RPSVPVRHLPENPHGDPEGRRCDGEGWEVAMTEMLNKEFTRKSFLRGGGALIVGFSLAGAATAGRAGAAAPTSAGYLPPTNQVDSWLTVNADNTVVFKTSQIEIGNGVTTGLGQIVAEELDLHASQGRQRALDNSV